MPRKSPKSYSFILDQLCILPCDSHCDTAAQTTSWTEQGRIFVSDCGLLFAKSSSFDADAGLYRSSLEEDVLFEYEYAFDLSECGTTPSLVKQYYALNMLNRVLQHTHSSFHDYVAPSQFIHRHYLDNVTCDSEYMMVSQAVFEEPQPCDALEHLDAAIQRDIRMARLLGFIDIKPEHIQLRPATQRGQPYYFIDLYLEPGFLEYQPLIADRAEIEALYEAVEAINTDTIECPPFLCEEEHSIMLESQKKIMKVHLLLMTLATIETQEDFILWHIKLEEVLNTAPLMHMNVESFVEKHLGEQYEKAKQKFLSEPTDMEAMGARVAMCCVQPAKVLGELTTTLNTAEAIFHQNPEASIDIILMPHEYDLDRFIENKSNVVANQLKRLLAKGKDIYVFFTPEEDETQYRIKLDDNGELIYEEIQALTSMYSNAVIYPLPYFTDSFNKRLWRNCQTILKDVLLPGASIDAAVSLANLYASTFMKEFFNGGGKNPFAELTHLQPPYTTQREDLVSESEFANFVRSLSTSQPSTDEDATPANLPFYLIYTNYSLTNGEPDVSAGFNPLKALSLFTHHATKHGYTKCQILMVQPKIKESFNLEDVFGDLIKMHPHIKKISYPGHWTTVTLTQEGEPSDGIEIEIYYYPRQAKNLFMTMMQRAELAVGNTSSTFDDACTYQIPLLPCDHRLLNRIPNLIDIIDKILKVPNFEDIHEASDLNKKQFIEIKQFFNLFITMAKPSMQPDEYTNHCETLFAYLDDDKFMRRYFRFFEYINKHYQLGLPFYDALCERSRPAITTAMRSRFFIEEVRDIVEEMPTEEDVTGMDLV